ncbi:hypothetical protein IEQ34_010431 [Dendrobium chrysotoxum]|uniref:Uncharacterized protein n=1 Tax=Dendrobium chrysotoxum TaxID=161865 RepID=A0AAV7H189_DENCH|nr:hypothetical protein IEQ34_010431 [Dendrobium chrysotoxum]
MESEQVKKLFSWSLSLSLSPLCFSVSLSALSLSLSLRALSLSTIFLVRRKIRLPSLLCNIVRSSDGERSKGQPSTPKRSSGGGLPLAVGESEAASLRQGQISHRRDSTGPIGGPAKGHVEGQSPGDQIRQGSSFSSNSSPKVTEIFTRSESAGSENAKPRSDSASPDKEDRFYPTRGSVAAAGDENGIGGCGGVGGEDRVGAAATVMPRFFISLSNKEKEEDFLAMKGCKLPQRPKKRSKILQKSLLLVSPGAWLTDLSYERYEVREKRSSRKRRRGLKAMCLESDSE